MRDLDGVDDDDERKRRGDEDKEDKEEREKDGEDGVFPGCGRTVCRSCAFETPERYVLGPFGRQYGGADCAFVSVSARVWCLCLVYSVVWALVWTPTESSRRATTARRGGRLKGPEITQRMSRISFSSVPPSSTDHRFICRHLLLLSTLVQ